MKIRLALVALTLLSPVAASAQDGRVQLDILDKLAVRASEKQEVTIDASTIGALGQSFLGQGAGADAAKQVLAKLQGIYVRSYEFDDPKAYSMDDINTMRRQLTTPGWTKIVSNEEKGKNGDWELQEVYFFQSGGKMGGIFIINSEPGELQVVNIVGPIDFGELGALGGVLGIPRVQDLGLGSPPPPPAAPAAPAPPRK